MDVHNYTDDCHQMDTKFFPAQGRNNHSYFRFYNATILKVESRSAAYLAPNISRLSNSLLLKVLELS